MILQFSYKKLTTVCGFQDILALTRKGVVMYNQIKKVIAIMCVLIVQISAKAQSLIENTTNSNTEKAFIQKAQEDYIKQDYPAVMKLIGTALRDSNISKTEIKNLMGLYQKIQFERKTPTELGWTLPASIDKIRVSSEYMDLDGEKNYNLVINTLTKPNVTLSSFTLRKYPNLVLVDLNKKIGKITTGLDHGLNYTRARFKSQALPINSGAYLLDLSLSSGEKVSGWFVITDHLNSSATPEFSNIETGHIFKNNSPVVSWPAFHSPEYTSQDKVVLGISFSPILNNKDWGDSVWTFWADNNSQRTSINVATDEPSEGSGHSIPSGPYFLQLSYHERRDIPPLRMIRTSKIVRTVKVP